MISKLNFPIPERSPSSLCFLLNRMISYSPVCNFTLYFPFPKSFPSIYLIFPFHSYVYPNTAYKTSFRPSFFLFHNVQHFTICHIFSNILFDLPFSIFFSGNLSIKFFNPFTCLIFVVVTMQTTFFSYLGLFRGSFFP